MIARQHEAAGAGLRQHFGRDRAHAGRQDRREIAGGAALISRPSWIGSPVVNEARVIEPFTSAIASGRSFFLMKVGPAAATGQICHLMSWSVSAWPAPMSELATRTSVVSSWLTGAGAGGGSSPPPARMAARPPAATATPKHYETRGFHTLHFPHDANGGDGTRLRISSPKGQFVVNEAYANQVNFGLSRHTPERAHPDAVRGRRISAEAASAMP